MYPCVHKLTFLQFDFPALQRDAQVGYIIIIIIVIIKTRSLGPSGKNKIDYKLFSNLQAPAARKTEINRSYGILDIRLYPFNYI